MLNLVDKPEIQLTITTDIDFDSLCVRAPFELLPEDKQEAIEKKPYLCRKRSLVNIYYKDEQYCLLFRRGYTWDGATIPAGFRWLIGAKGDPKFLFPSMVHDKLCENHSFIKNNRYLSSLIFKELLLACGVGKVKAELMFIAVDNFQKAFGKWEEN